MESNNSPKDRRAHLRFQVNIDANITLDKGVEMDCRIKDICEGGALLTCADAAWRLDSGTPCSLSFTLDPQPGDDCHFKARTVRLAGTALGVRFIRSSKPDMQRLKAFLQQQSARGVKSPSRYNASISLNVDGARVILQRISLQRLPSIIEFLQEAILNQLWENSEHASSDAERSALTGDIARLGQAARSGHFLELIRSRLFDPMLDLETPVPRRSRQAEQSGLELVDPDRFEVWLTGSAMVNRLEQELNTSLGKLRAQTERVFGKLVELPVEPQGIALALEEATKQIGLRPAAQSTCLQVAREKLPHRLGEFYNELIHAWEVAGLRIAPPKPVETTRATPSPTEPAPDSGAAPAHGEAASMTDWLLDQDSHYEPGSGDTNLKQLVARLFAETEGSRPEIHPGGYVEERIDVTDRMLSHMQEDPWVPSKIKEFIKHLSMRFLALAVSEPAFFRDPTHPMVKLIDQLEHLSMLAPDSTELDELVQKALNTDPRDQDRLSNITGQLETMAQRYAGAYQRNAERLVASKEGKERLREAREQVREQFNRAFAGRPIHRTVQELIEQAWRALLELVHLRKGGESPAWKGYWQALLSVHQLSGGKKLDSGELPKTDEALKRIRDGLSYIGFDTFRRSTLLDGLQKALRSARAGTQSPEDFINFQAIPTGEAGEKHKPSPEGLSTTDWKHALEQVENMDVGAVLRFHDEGQERVLHLVWRDGTGHELVFVDPHNLEARSVARDQLALDIHKGLARTQPPQEQSATERATMATIEEMQSRISYHETHDSLTGLSNRRRLIGLLTDMILHEPDSFNNSVLGFLDIDHYDTLTGSYGYRAGERMLVAMAKLLENTLRDASCIAYLGGSRFAFIQAAENTAAAQKHAKKLRAAITALPFYWNTKPYPVEGSLGLSMVTAECDNPETLLSAADSACTAARSAGGNRVVVFHEKNKIIARQRHVVDSWLKAEEVVRSQRLRLRCQRIAETDSELDKNHHYEILLSVYDDQGAPMPLEEFISAAEAFNLMADMDRLVLEQALKWVHEQPQSAAHLGGIAINLSGQSLGNEDLVERVRGHMQDMSLDPRLISFEVTETAAIANLDQAVAIIEGIRTLGCRFALDDFGTGLSSYSYLKKMPVDYLKIDGSFIKDMLENPQDVAIVKSMNEIAHFMGKETIAEYVESPEIRERLREIGVDYVQGYAVEKPRYLDEIGELAKQAG